MWLPLPAVCLHPNARAHYRVRAKAVAQYRGLAKLFATSFKRNAEPWKFARYDAAFFFQRTRDEDGLIAWLKPYFDGLQDARVIENDSRLRNSTINRFSGKAKNPQRHTSVFLTVWQCDQHYQPEKYQDGLSTT
jgi:hypothetical protein